MGSMIPVAGKEFKNAKYEVEQMGTIAAGIYKAVGWIAGKIVDATGLNDYMQKLADKFCEMFKDPFMAISADFLAASCGAIEFDGGVGTWPCTEECAGDPPKTITYSGDRKVCDDEKNGAATATCYKGNVDDDNIDDNDYENDYDIEQPDTDIEMTVTQELVENITTGTETPDVTITKRTETVPPENTGQEYFSIYFNSFLDGGETTPPALKKTVVLRGLGEPLYASGFPGMNVIFYLDWNEYFEVVTTDNAPAGFVIKGSGWNGWYVFDKPEIQIFGTTGNQGSIWVNIVLPDDPKYLGTHEFEIAFLNQKSDGTPLLSAAGPYSTFSLKLLEKDGYVSCHSDLECDTETQVCDVSYYYCVPK